MAKVIDEETAKTTPCKCFQIQPDELMCFSKGAIGTLSDGQERTLCTQKEISPATKGQKERIAKFTETIHAAHEKYVEKGKPGIKSWLETVGEEAKKRGVEI